MDDRRRTISSEEQMIGEALMRVSNTLEAQRLTKSLDYQEKLRSRSNIRLIIAVICLFTAMMMMMISGALLFVLWRYADPILDIVVPFAKGMTGDFATIWDGLVETLSYVPVMVEQLTRLLEQVIIMLEGINAIDLAGIMGKLGAMLDDVFAMMDDLKPALQSMIDSVGRMLQGLADNGLDGLLKELLGDDAAASIAALMDSTWYMVRNMAEGIDGLVDSGALDELMDGAGELLTSSGQALGRVSGSLDNITSDDTDKLVAAGGTLINEAAETLNNLSGSLDGITSDDIEAVVSGGSEALQSVGSLLSRLSSTLDGLLN